jgi:hypothetical protein
MLCALCVGTVHAADPTAANSESWAKTLLPMTDDGWEPLASSASAFVYLSYRDAGRQGPIATAWMRKEYVESHPWMGYFPSRSIVSRVEVDCARRTMRDIASTGYAGNNLAGESKSWTANRPTLWSPAEPGTVAEMAVQEICNRTTRLGANSRPPP